MLLYLESLAELGEFDEEPDDSSQTSWHLQKKKAIQIPIFPSFLQSKYRSDQ